MHCHASYTRLHYKVDTGQHKNQLQRKHRVHKSMVTGDTLYFKSIHPLDPDNPGEAQTEN